MTEVERAAEMLKQGGLVAFPTETVYGLGADATNARAVARIFQVKGRPANNPLIVHVAGVVVAKRYAARWSDATRVLAERFWPGPLTLVVPKMPEIVDEATGGGQTVGLRMPDHPLALALLAAFDGPVAAPSANRSNRISPTTAGHVRAELGDAVDYILDGGPCSVGIESTVLDVSEDQPRILRPGRIKREQIEAVVGPIDVANALEPAGAALQSPGRLPVHYAPTAPAYRFEVGERVRVLTRPVPGACYLLMAAPDDHDLPQSASIHIMSDDPATYARRLYGVLRDLDAQHPAAIYVEMPPNTPQWVAVRDRLMRATRPWE